MIDLGPLEVLKLVIFYASYLDFPAAAFHRAAAVADGRA